MKQLIRLTEQDLHRIVKESVKKILKEESFDRYENDRKQARLWNMVKEYLSKMGFQERGNGYDNTFVLKVNINNSNDINIIKAALSRYLGVSDEYDLSVDYKTTMFGGNAFAIIRLPGFNKVTTRILDGM